MNKIKLFEPEHIYRHIETGEEFVSVSRMIGSFKKKFDAEYWARRKAYQDLVPTFPSIAKKYKDGDYKLFDELHEHIRNENLFNATVKNYHYTWGKKRDKANEKGTAFHEKMEKKDYKNGYAINPVDNKPYKIYSNDEVDFENLKPGCYPELILWDEANGICGTADKPFLVPDPTYSFLYCDMFDYKTNDDLLKGAYKKEKFLKPFNKIEVTKVNTYTFQQSSYHYILFLYGVVPRSSWLLYAPDYNEKQMGTIKIPIWLNLAKQMHELFASKKKS